MFKKACSLLLAATLMVSLVACGGKKGVAATVNRTEIKEDTVTARIMVMRDSNPNYADDVAWAKSLNALSLTPEQLRENTINYYIDLELIYQEADKQKVAVDKDIIDNDIATQRASLNLAEDDAGWLALLKTWGFPSAEDYRYWIEAMNLKAKITGTISAAASPDEEQLHEFVINNAAHYVGKRSALILLVPNEGETEDELYARAQNVLNRINAGEDFAALALEYSQGVIPTGADGDVGWDKVNGNLDQAYRNALEGLSVGQISGLVRTNSGICIIKCTEEFWVSDPSEVDYNSVPVDIITILSNQLSYENQIKNVDKYFAELRDKANISINDMPKNLPYDVDMNIINDQPVQNTEDQPEGEGEGEPEGEGEGE
jgi:foldase protein PrsA